MDPVFYLQEVIARGNVLSAVFAFAWAAFMICMILDCVQHRRDCFWLWIIVATGGLGALFYFYQFHWEGDFMHGLVWAGFAERRRMKELKSRVHYFDKAADHEELGDCYQRLHKFAEAEKCYRTALERDPKAFDSQVQLGNVLLAQDRADEAWEYLRPSYEENPTYAEDHLLWQCARCQAARGEYAESAQLYDYLLERHSYCEAQTEFAQVLIRAGEYERAAELLHEMIEDHSHSPAYVQRRDARWIRQARSLLRSIPARVNVPA